jgi:formylmethanofuran:tetrahydromethanopterin formyltransferase
MFLARFCSTDPSGSFSTGIINSCYELARPLEEWSDIEETYASALKSALKRLLITSRCNSYVCQSSLDPVDINIFWSNFDDGHCYRPGTVTPSGYLRAILVLQYSDTAVLNLELLCKYLSCELTFFSPCLTLK